MLFRYQMKLHFWHFFNRLPTGWNFLFRLPDVWAKPLPLTPLLIISHASFQYIKWQMERKGAVDYTYTSELDEFRGEITNVIQISINLVRKVRILVEFQQHYIGSNNIKLDRHVISSIVYEKLKWCVGDSSIIYQDLFIRKLKWQDRSFHHLQARLKGNAVQISILSARKSFLCWLCSLQWMTVF